MIPNKYDIIPIHTSDISAFLSCRRRWNWSSPSRQNLRRRVEQYGIYMPLWFGNGIHFALEMYYAEEIDPVKAFEIWYNIQWNGGVVTEDWLDRIYDAEPVPYQTSDLNEAAALGTPDEVISEGITYEMDNPQWVVKGLKELHPDPDLYEFEEHRLLGIGMMEYYKVWAPKNDNFTVIAAESTFSIPLGFSAIDTREHSPNYGQELEVHARGKRDSVIQDNSSGQYGIIDYKSASKIDENYFLKLENDFQVGNYGWASQEEAKLYDLPYKVISFIDYQAMWKKFPDAVLTLKDGIQPSISRTDQSCSAEMFWDHIQNSGLMEWYRDNAKAQAFYQYLQDEGDKRFIDRHRTYRSQTSFFNTGQEIRMIAMDMLDANLKIYKRPTGDYGCTRCAFRAPCLMMDDGADYEYMLDAGFEQNRGR